MTDFFAANRARLGEKLHGGLVVVTAYTGMQRSNDAASYFDQEANFWWLTGIEAADWWLIYDGSRQKAWLVAPTRSRSHEIFDGSLNFETAVATSGVDKVLLHEEGMSLLRSLAKKHSIVYTAGEQPHVEYLDFSLNPAPKKLQETLERTFNSVLGCRKELAQLRAIKQPEELARMKNVIDLTVDAFEIVKAMLPMLKHEYEIDAEFSYYFRKRGAKGHAYDPIVAAGKNACTLHYGQNDAKLKKRELVLLDIGARQDGYAADITRTYAYGEPTKRQRAVHQAVVAAQQQIIALLGPDISVEQYQRDVDTIMTDALMSLGLMSHKGDDERYRTYFPHAVSHGLGVDVHDSLGAPRVLQPGMVLTVEPGIYIPEEGIGVRIEDDILISPSGHSNLSGRLSTDL